MPARHNNLVSISVLLFLVLAAVPAMVFGAATGQIKGKLTDEETGEAVIGASVQIVGTSMGAMTDFDGNYIIRQLEPGSYTVKISHLDYATIEVTHVEVNADLTSEVTQKLTKKVSELDEKIVVRGTRDIIDKFAVANEQTISKEVIESKPVTTVEELLTQVAGVVQNSQGEIFIRGGRAGEVAYIVDGVPIGDPLGGLGQAGANLSLVSGSIQEFTVIKDGFDPEYGNALSGIVKITTQTGSKDNTSLGVQYMTDDLGSKELNEFSRDYDYVRFTLSGPDPILFNKVFPALGINFLQDKEFTYYFYAEVEKSNGIHQYEQFQTDPFARKYGSFNFFGLDIPERKENAYYVMSNLKYRPRPNMKVIRAPGDPTNPGHGLDPYDFTVNSDWERFDDYNGNGVYDPPEPVINLFADTLEFGFEYTLPNYTQGEANVDVNIQGGEFALSEFRFNSNGYVDNLEGEPFLDLNGNGVWDRGDYLHDQNGNGILDADRTPIINNRDPEPYTDGDSIIGEPFEDINGNNVYDAGVDVFIRSAGPDNMDLNHNGRHDGPLNVPPIQWQPGIPYLDRNGNGVFDVPNSQYDVGEPYIDVNGNMRYDRGGSANFLRPGSYDEDAIWHYRNTDTYRGELKLFWQLGNHELKGGFAMTREELTFQEIERPYYPYTGRSDGGPYPDRGALRDMFEYQPWRGTVYFRDKLEYGSMIASLGFRWDYFIQDKYDLVEIAKQDDLGSGVILGDRHKFSPRIGFSYPISDKAKIHFNYGHFFQLPSLLRMYRRNTVSVDQDIPIGNYNLDYQKTIQYSFGVKYAMNENYSIDVSGYFKDEFDKINSRQVTVERLTYQQYQNSDYGRSRGFELTLEKRGGGYVNGQLSYTYAFAYGKASQTNENYMTDFELSREPLSESPLDNDIRHRVVASVQIFVPSTVKPRLFGLPILNGWSLALETLIESGAPFTPGRAYPNLELVPGEDIQNNSLRMPGTLQFDLRFTKDFKFVGLDYSFILWVENVFDSRNVDYVYSNTGRPDTQQNLNQTIKGGTSYDLNPNNWDYGRQIRVGLELNL